MALTPGTRLGPYEVTAQIGVGGMGEVQGRSAVCLDMAHARMGGTFPRVCTRALQIRPLLRGREGTNELLRAL